MQLKFANADLRERDYPAELHAAQGRVTAAIVRVGMQEARIEERKEAVTEAREAHEALKAQKFAAKAAVVQLCEEFAALQAIFDAEVRLGLLFIAMGCFSKKAIIVLLAKDHRLKAAVNKRDTP